MWGDGGVSGWNCLFEKGKKHKNKPAEPLCSSLRRVIFLLEVGGEGSSPKRNVRGGIPRRIHARATAALGREWRQIIKKGRTQEQDRVSPRIHGEGHGIDALTTHLQRPLQFRNIVIEANDLGAFVVDLAAGGIVQWSAEHAVESRVDVVARVVFKEDRKGVLSWVLGGGQAGRHELGVGDVADLGEEVDEGGASLRVAGDEGVGSRAVDGMTQQIGILVLTRIESVIGRWERMGSWRCE